MLSLANVSAAHGVNYYKMDNYYTAKDSVGYSKWAGQSAQQLGLEGAVDARRFSGLLKGIDEKIRVSGQGVQAEDRKRAGLDMTFSAPKSVSLQALVFGDQRLVEAHRHAVADAIRYAEMHYAVYRGGPKSNREIRRGRGLLIAQFEHDSSRLKDPQLHTHNVVLNRIENEKGEVRALHGDLIYKNSVLLGLIYQNSLARRVRELGYQIRPNSNGTFELEGFTKEQLVSFSKRREQIEAMSPDSYRKTRDLVLKNRKAKSGPQHRHELVESWLKEAKQHNIKAIETQSMARPSEFKKRLPQPEISLSRAISSLEEKSSVFSKEAILKETLQMSLGNHTLNQLEHTLKQGHDLRLVPTREKNHFTSKEAVERDLMIRALIDAGVASQEPLAREEPVRARVQNLQKLDVEKASIALTEATERLRTLGLSEEKALQVLSPVQSALRSVAQLSLHDLTTVRGEISRALEGLHSVHGTSKSKPLLSQVMQPLQKSFLAPTRGQMEAIERTLTSTDQFIVWQGVAGAGKTFSVRQIAEEARLAGIAVQGFAPSAAAAGQLSKEAGLDAQTLQSHLLKREPSNDQKKLWIVDEAGMVAAKDFLALLKKAEVHSARVLFVGDVRQLSPVDAGNPFLDIQRNTGTTRIVLDESLRQKDPTLQAAVRSMNQGDVVQGLSQLNERIAEHSTEKGRIKRVVQEFQKRAHPGDDAPLLLARTNRIRGDLTHEIRSSLKQQGFLRNEIQLPVLRKIDVSQARLKLALSYTKEDVLVPHRNYKSLGLRKDSQYEVIGTNVIKNTVTVQSAGLKIEIPVSRHHGFSLFSKHTLAVAEGDKMIWNRNDRARSQLNNEGFVVLRVAVDALQIRTESGQLKTVDPRIPQHMEHAWALTTYKAQGQTATRVLQLVDEGTSKRDLLVGVTRASEDVLLVAQSHEALKRSAQMDHAKAIAAEEVSESVQKRVFGSVSRGR
jgi:conjugative relaxase-like TrwC/TraI family protein